eukprot:CAMPEP_0204339206 /NCGR_PEP_ID=MMETSP0469-20131031/21633_1 /ASSEMBLY_ACC=CAM_ASM_000384 /TAXON_ID=2969 /ORGANISM="Oxyrrhis marina" /LENGTH=85 /DNA_ID=CAMNT_0051323527 /DNA_START=1 /DNA_END=255 /DNA_ORIENTATION=+
MSVTGALPPSLEIGEWVFIVGLKSAEQHNFKPGLIVPPLPDDPVTGRYAVRPRPRFESEAVLVRRQCLLRARSDRRQFVQQLKWG